jgi:hypothetical protein
MRQEYYYFPRSVHLVTFGKIGTLIHSERALFFFHVILRAFVISVSILNLKFLFSPFAFFSKFIAPSFCDYTLLPSPILFYRTVASFCFGILIYLFFFWIGIPFVCWADHLSRSQPSMPLPLPRTVLRSAVPLARGRYLFVPFMLDYPYVFYPILSARQSSPYHFHLLAQGPYLFVLFFVVLSVSLVSSLFFPDNTAIECRFYLISPFFQYHIICSS